MKTKVKVLAVADLHGRYDLLDASNVDIVIVAGDFGPGGTHNGYQSDAWAQSAALRQWFAAYSSVRFYILPGNHDLFAKHHAGREVVDMAWPSNVTLIKDKGVVDPSGLTIWGMPWNPIHYKAPGEPTSSKGGAFAADDAKIIAKCEKIINRFGQLDILVTHAPPRIADTTFAHGGWHMNTVLGAMIPKISPRLVICGHKHTMSHKPIVVGNTTIVNVSLMVGHHDSQFTYQPRVIELEVERKLDVKMDMTSEMLAPVTSLSKVDHEWLKEMSIRIEKTVRGMNKLIDEGKAHETETRSTGKKFRKEVNLERLQHLAPLDKTGRVAKLVDVVKMIQASAADGWKTKVLPHLWQPKAPCYCYPGKRGNVDFAEYRYV